MLVHMVCVCSLFAHWETFHPSTPTDACAGGGQLVLLLLGRKSKDANSGYTVVTKPLTNTHTFPSQKQGLGLTHGFLRLP